MKFEQAFLHYIKAGATLIQIISHETQRIHGVVNKTANELERSWFSWNRIEGIKKWEQGEFIDEDTDCREAASVLEKFEDDDFENSLLILEDCHPDLTENQPHIIRRLRNIALRKYTDRALILAQPITGLPVELEKEVQVMEMPLPTVDELRVVLASVCRRFDLEDNQCEQTLPVLEAALGLSIMEAELAFAKTIVEKGRITETEIPLIIAEKEQVIRKSGYLEYHHPQENLNDVGGLDKLKEWLNRRANAFSESAREYGLEQPRGILLLGVPGTGKSLAAKAASKAWQFPLLRLDMGKIYGGIVGQSEQNIRGALGIAETLAPCILWIDEIEKGLSGAQSSGATDGGTTSRVLGTFLTWMQEKTKPVFVLATANDISQLPPELLRKGRVDEIFFVDLPDSQARQEILNIHLRRRQREFSKIELSRIAKEAKGYTGAELEEAVKEALFRAFDEGRQLNPDDVIAAIKDSYPLSKTMQEVIEATRKWAKNRAVQASSQEPEAFDEKENKAPRLRQEAANPFIAFPDCVRYNFRDNAGCYFLPDQE
ncbi:MAG TPA: AAA family ATPase [Thiotrichaceae bacterium]|nr:AAA family ATPase [Thiotrichaceae bacterium]